MELRQLRTLVAIADYGSFATAADAVCLTQSAISLQIKKLETEIGIKLFDRRHRPPVLNEKGGTLVKQARKVIELCDDIKRSGSNSPLEGSLAFGAVPTSINSILPPALVMMRERHPNLHIKVISGLSTQLAAAIHTGEIDAAIVTEPDKLSDGLVSHPICREPYLVIAPPHATGETDRELLESQKFIQFSRAAWAGRQIEQHMSDRSIKVKHGMEIDSLDSIAQMVRSGLGVSVMPVGRTQSKMLDGLKWLPFGNPPLHRSLVMIERKTNSSAQLAGALTEAMRQVSSGHI